MEALWRDLLVKLNYDPRLGFVDSFPVPVCRLPRAYRCRKLRELASFGYDEMSKQNFYGLRAHAHVCYPGVIARL